MLVWGWVWGWGWGGFGGESGCGGGGGGGGKGVEVDALCGCGCTDHDARSFFVKMFLPCMVVRPLLSFSSTSCGIGFAA